MGMKIIRGVEPRIIFAVCSANAVNENNLSVLAPNSAVKSLKEPL